MRAPRITQFDTRSAWQRLLAGGMTEPEADALVTREILRAELYRAIMIQTGVFTAIVAAVVAVIVALLTRL